MKDINRNTDVNATQSLDTSKRKTLKAFGGIAATGALASLPGVAAANYLNDALASSRANKTNTPSFASKIDGMLVSIPNVQGETLILNNPTDKPIKIDHFHASNIAFDGEIIDCNEACATKSIKIPANENVLIQFNPKSKRLASSYNGLSLDLDKGMYRLPAGTRVVPFAARVSGSAATLAEKVGLSAA